MLKWKWVYYSRWHTHVMCVIFSNILTIAVYSYSWLYCVIFQKSDKSSQLKPYLTHSSWARARTRRGCGGGCVFGHGKYSKYIYSRQRVFAAGKPLMKVKSMIISYDSSLRILNASPLHALCYMHSRRHPFPSIHVSIGITTFCPQKSMADIAVNEFKLTENILHMSLWTF